VIPKEEQMSEVAVYEGDRTVWEKGRYVPGTAGITGASQGTDGSITIEVGSGRYAFKLTGQ